jgi:hypothetical protein
MVVMGETVLQHGLTTLFGFVFLKRDNTSQLKFSTLTDGVRAAGCTQRYGVQVQ